MASKSPGPALNVFIVLLVFVGWLFYVMPYWLMAIVLGLPTLLWVHHAVRTATKKRLAAEKARREAERIARDRAVASAIKAQEKANRRAQQEIQVDYLIMKTKHTITRFTGGRGRSRR